jgi:hypothetical protein
MELLDLLQTQHCTLLEIQQHLNRVEGTLNEVLGKLNPVHEHAEWVDSLRAKLHDWKLISDRPRLVHSGTKDACESTESSSVIKESLSSDSSSLTVSKSSLSSSSSSSS